MSESSFSFKSIMFALAIALLMPIMVNIFAAPSTSLNTDEALAGYYDFTGSTPSQESIWVLTGIYTAFGDDGQGGTDTAKFGHTDDGWLYGSSIKRYTPSQYNNSTRQYTVLKGDDGVFRYWTPEVQEGEAGYDTYVKIKNKEIPVTEYGDHYYGDLYSDVTMDLEQQSYIFFTQDTKNTKGEYFYYDYSGYRYAFQPTANYRTINSDGENVEVVANTSSLSLIWYNYYTSTGISGQLIISSQDKGVAYLTASEIIQAFNSTTSTAKFQMNFSGIPMNVYVRLDASYLTQHTVEEAYNNGYWSLMVTSDSADASAYTQSDYGFNIFAIWNTIVNLLTFNYQDYDMSDTMGYLCSFLFVAPLYATLIAIGLQSVPALILAGILAAIQGIATLITNAGVWDWFGGLF